MEEEEGGEPPAAAAEEAEVGEEPASQAAAEAPTGEGAAASGEAGAEATEAAAEEEGPQLEALPEGSKAAENVKYVENKQGWVFTYEKVTFQVTGKQANGGVNAQRVAELCYSKFEQGMAKEQVAKYRDAICKKLRPAPKRASTGPDGAPAPKRRKAGPNQSLLEVLEKKGLLDGALRIHGRAVGKKNHESINGIFVRHAKGFDGRPAYVKVVLNGTEVQSFKRYLYFSASGKKWKISDELGDSRGGFCFLKGSGSGPPLANGQGATVWQVFDGKSAGYNADAAVRSSLVRPADARAARAAGAGGSSSSSSSSSSSDDDEKEGEAELPSSQPLSQQDSPASQQAPQMPLPPQNVRVCAKAAVRSGLRCPNSYALLGPSGGR